jgi:hypothetical protein
MADTDGAEAGVFRGHDVTERGHGRIPQGTEAGVDVTAEEKGGVSHAVEISGQVVGQIIKLSIGRSIKLFVEN